MESSGFPGSWSDSDEGMEDAATRRRVHSELPYRSSVQHGPVRTPHMGRVDAPCQGLRHKVSVTVSV